MEALKQSIREKGKMVVAFSGGVDSTFLLKVAHDVLGDGAVAVTARSCSFPERELREAKAFCEKEHIKHIVVESEELQIEGFSHNPTNRCYLCKKEYDIPYVAEASNLDDNGDYRPGLMAVAELSVLSPLREAGMNKSMIRELSHGLGLPTWNKQSFACLSSRFVYGEEITEERLGMVDRAEQLLLDAGFHQVRVRIHESGTNTIARIEIGTEDFAKMFADDFYQKVNAACKEIGFTYVTLDLGGYRMGSMNDGIRKA